MYEFIFIFIINTILFTYLFIYSFFLRLFFLGEISYTATLVIRGEIKVMYVCMNRFTEGARVRARARSFSCL